MRKPDLENEYRSLQPDTTRFCDTLKHELEKMFANKKLTLGIPLQSRVKDWDSISGKMERKDLIIDSVKDLDDLIGIRAVFLFKRDMTEACSLVKDTSVRLDESQFGYQSLHYVIKPPGQWLTVPSFEGLGTFSAELQMRTMAQHIWASASHQLQYKHEDGVPQPVRRTIHRVSALLETVDLEFERVLQEREKYMAGVRVESADQLNVDSLAHVLNSMLPSPNKAQHEKYADLLPELTAFNITTTKTLATLIEKHLSTVLVSDKQWASIYKKTQRGKKGVYFTHVGLVRRIMHKEFGKKWIQAAHSH